MYFGGEDSSAPRGAVRILSVFLLASSLVAGCIESPEGSSPENNEPGLDAAADVFTPALDASVAEVGPDSESIDMPDPSRFVDIAVSDTGACALADDGRVFCWGDNGSSNFKTILEQPEGLLAPSHVALDYRFSALSAGSRHYCGVTIDGAIAKEGQVVCWGANHSGQASSDESANAFPTLIDLQPGTYVDVAAGGSHSCALGRNQSVHCWGSNEEGQLGQSENVSPLAPAPVPNVSAQAISAGSNHTCLIELGEGAQLRCWGYNLYREVSDRDCTSNICGITRSGGTTPYRAVSAGEFSTCGVDRDGKVLCRGGNRDGRLGIDVVVFEVESFTGNGATNAIRVEQHLQHGCSLRPNGKVDCWGTDPLAAGAEGSDAIVPPKQVETELQFSHLDVARGRTCAISTDGAVYCWGSNARGVLNGQESPESSRVPLLVIDRPPTP